MRLSEIKGERTFEVIAELIDPVSNIAQDEAAMRLFQKQKPPKDVDPREFTANRLKDAAKALLRTHADDLTAIMAALEGVSIDEYRKGQNLATTLGGLYELVTDEEFIAFFS